MNNFTVFNQTLAFITKSYNQLIDFCYLKKPWEASFTCKFWALFILVHYNLGWILDLLQKVRYFHSLPNYKSYFFLPDPLVCLLLTLMKVFLNYVWSKTTTGMWLIFWDRGESNDPFTHLGYTRKPKAVH